MAAELAAVGGAACPPRRAGINLEWRWPLALCASELSPKKASGRVKSACSLTERVQACRAKVWKHIQNEFADMHVQFCVDVFSRCLEALEDEGYSAKANDEGTRSAARYEP